MNYVKEYSEFIKNFFENSKYTDKIHSEKYGEGVALDIPININKKLFLLALEPFINCEKETSKYPIEGLADALIGDPILVLAFFFEAMFWKEQFEKEKAKQAARIVDDAIVKASDESKS